MFQLNVFSQVSGLHHGFSRESILSLMKESFAS